MADIVGQEAVTTALEKSLESGKLHHAYLFSGARGTGKTSVARILAHAVNGFAYELEKIHPDIIEIDAASNTGVDNIRELIERAALAPTAGKYKIYIIDEVHMLSRSAFNALLKTLEEPPESVIFILATTDPEKVPITILSRVQHFKFRLADSSTIAKYLRMVANKEKFAISDEALEFLAESSGGSFRDALSLLEQANAVCGEKDAISRAALEAAFGVPNLENISALVDCFNKNDTEKVGQLLDEAAGNHKSFIEGLARQILKTPTASTLALLDDLVGALKTPAIDPALQIRLAFLRRMMPAQPLVNQLPVSQETARGLGDPSRPTGDSPSIARHTTGLRESSASEAGGADAIPTGKRSKSVPAEPSNFCAYAPNPGDFNWEEVLETIKQSDIGLWAILAKRQSEITDTEVKIYAEKLLWANKLESTDNYAKISRLVAPRKFVVTTEKAPPSETAIKVSAILGVDATELKEVEVPDGI
jgi:DNA polymerase-3 subunit gamma/tau